MLSQQSLRCLLASSSVNYFFDHIHTCNLLNISALHVQYGIQAFAKFKRPECTRSHCRELQSQKFSRRSMRPKLPRKVHRSQSYLSRILPLYTTSLLFTLFCQSGTYPFLDIGIVRCDWLRSKPKQSKFDQELLEMSQTHMLISKNVNNDVTMNYCWFSVSRHSK